MDNFILEINSVLSPQLCKNIIEKFESDKESQSDGVLGDSERSCIDKSSKDSKEIIVTSSKGWEKAQKKIRFYYEKALDKYFKHIKDILVKKGLDENDLDFVLDNTFPPIFIGSHTIQKISKGKHYRWHQDSSFTEHRLLTSFIYLNTLGPDGGGTTDFINGQVIEPVAGKMVIFPSTWTYLHTGRLVKADDKYILVTNVHRST